MDDEPGSKLFRGMGGRQQMGGVGGQKQRSKGWARAVGGSSLSKRGEALQTFAKLIDIGKSISLVLS